MLKYEIIIIILSINCFEKNDNDWRHKVQRYTGTDSSQLNWTAGDEQCWARYFKKVISYSY